MFAAAGPVHVPERFPDQIFYRPVIGLLLEAESDACAVVAADETGDPSGQKTQLRVRVEPVVAALEDRQPRVMLLCEFSHCFVGDQVISASVQDLSGSIPDKWIPQHVC